MLHFELIDTSHSKPTTRIISLPDNARGADMYLELRRRGFQLRRLEFKSDD
jgi:hypothetical protein